MGKKLRHYLIVVLRVTFITIVVSFISLEILLRLITTVSSNGVVTYEGMELRPLAVPITEVSESIETYLNPPEDLLFIYDPLLGWTFNPNHEGVMVINNDGLRADQEYALTPDDDVIRIAIFGDSYMAGNEVGETENFPYYLEQELQALGINAEVLNFGVGGYGMDQAYLRWVHLGQDYNPDIVLMGFQPENMHRNVNILRALFVPTGLPFLKPRFIINENDEFVLFNSPVPPPEEVVAILENFEASPLAEHEYHYNELYQSHWLDFSYLWRLATTRIYDLNFIYGQIPPDDERVQVTQLLMRQFQEDVEATDAEFVLMNTPNIAGVINHLNGGLRYQFVLDPLIEDMSYIPAEQAFTTFDDLDWAPNGHYSPQGNQLVAQYAAQWLAGCITDETCINN